METRGNQERRPPDFRSLWTSLWTPRVASTWFSTVFPQAVKITGNLVKTTWKSKVCSRTFLQPRQILLNQLLVHTPFLIIATGCENRVETKNVCHQMCATCENTAKINASFHKFPPYFHTLWKYSGNRFRLPPGFHTIYPQAAETIVNYMETLWKPKAISRGSPFDVEIQ